MTILKLEDLKYKFEGSNRYILKNINIEFEKGKIYSIIGNNESDKSTLLAIIAGLDVCTSGNIYFKENNIKNLKLDLYRFNHVGTIFKDYNFFKNVTVIDNILMSMDLKKGTEKNKIQLIYDIMEKLNIDKEKLFYKANKLSYIDSIMLSIVRVIANDTDIIIIDNITEDMNEESEINIMEIMSRLAYENNKCIIISTNSKGVTSYSDEIWGLSNGTLMYIKGKENEY
ncbi:ABC transporter ATP-binding protein [[Clostridium] sordellii]|uniref:ATP-binding cassette domain-containing protein n=1 Tax=Paraclostridium sordellii TaxID=1505 RepID=UPI0005E143F2|nr:ATP-binding cassette domain-containing protein [Paeniclostridium sordellii]CEQ22035.1 ABC transporter ATP-binding protein [[Clostridium] sordellii] [Paeniclostridium sordellii]